MREMSDGQVGTKLELRKASDAEDGAKLATERASEARDVTSREPFQSQRRSGWNEARNVPNERSSSWARSGPFFCEARICRKYRRSRRGYRQCGSWVITSRYRKCRRVPWVGPSAQYPRQTEDEQRTCPRAGAQRTPIVEPPPSSSRTIRSRVTRLFAL